jgi:hypothetical protein
MRPLIESDGNNVLGDAKTFRRPIVTPQALAMGSREGAR